LTRTMSPVLKFASLLFHLWRICKFCINYFFHLDQNSFARYCTCRHLFLQYMSSFWNTAGGGNTTLFFIVNIECGDSGRLVGSWRFSVVSGLEFTTHSASARNVLNDSSFRLLE
jgi:hypothetical protein